MKSLARFQQWNARDMLDINLNRVFIYKAAYLFFKLFQQKEKKDRFKWKLEGERKVRKERRKYFSSAKHNYNIV